jgi:DNA-binding CsgD family transcriptional regulator
MPKSNATEEFDDQPSGLTAFESKLVNLLALLLVQERKQPEQIALLNRAGFRPAEIAALLGTTRNTVSVQLSNQKRERNVAIAPKPKR